MKYFALKLNPPRPTFSQDMNEDERAIMQRHVTYWMDLMSQGKVLAFGPVLDPAGAYGLGIIQLEDESQLESLMAGDPATSVCSYDAHPMMAITPQKQ